jgi:hypothetical protein
MNIHSLLFLTVLSLFSLNLSAQSSAVKTALMSAEAEGKAPAISWKAESHDFGAITQNVPVSVEFTLRNEGQQPLLISEVKTSCGCTATGYSREPVAPGETAGITVSYNAKTPGVFHKTVMVFTNAGSPQRLTIRGEVK